jgi:hypothetical protein
MPVAEDTDGLTLQLLDEQPPADLEVGRPALLRLLWQRKQRESGGGRGVLPGL